MKATVTDVRIESEAVLRREIHRFLKAAHQRGEIDCDQRRRTERRCQRSWPLLASFSEPAMGPDTCVALHNASPLGIAFLCPRQVPTGSIVMLKLFWHDDDSPFVPAVVRHSTRNHHGYIVGCAFCVDRDDSERQLATNHEAAPGQDW